MNYRHAYHAGNFADCFKHALLVALLDTFGRKPAPYFVVDTHAGAGQYDLEAAEAQRTGEAQAGIRRLVAHRPPALAQYLDLVARLGLYPGSPALIRAMMRSSDRLACCEMHPVDSVTLRRLFRRDPTVEVHNRSGWEALGALLPPKEKRGLVFIDPPFESRDEFLVLMDGLRRGHARFPSGVFAAWYPIKQMAAVRGFHADMAASGIRDVITVDLFLREPTNPELLSGCGLLIINPPYQWAERAASIASAVLTGLDAAEAGARTIVSRLTDE